MIYRCVAVVAAALGLSGNEGGARRRRRDRQEGQLSSRPHREGFQGLGGQQGASHHELLVRSGCGVAHQFAEALHRPVLRQLHDEFRRSSPCPRCRGEVHRRQRGSQPRDGDRELWREPADRAELHGGRGTVEGSGQRREVLVRISERHSGRATFGRDGGFRRSRHDSRAASLRKEPQFDPRTEDAHLTHLRVPRGGGTNLRSAGDDRCLQQVECRHLSHRCAGTVRACPRCVPGCAARNDFRASDGSMAGSNRAGRFSETSAARWWRFPRSKSLAGRRYPQPIAGNSTRRRHQPRHRHWRRRPTRHGFHQPRQPRW